MIRFGQAGQPCLLCIPGGRKGVEEDFFREKKKKKKEPLARICPSHHFMNKTTEMLLGCFLPYHESLSW